MQEQLKKLFGTVLIWMFLTQPAPTMNINVKERCNHKKNLTLNKTIMSDIF